MAMYLRRAISFTSSVMLRRSCNCAIQIGNFSNHLISNSGIHRTQNLPAFNFLGDHCRGFAKGKKSKDDSAGDTVQFVPDIGPTIKAGAASQMDAAIVALSRELAKLRTGRASAGMLDHIIVETDGLKLPLNRLAVVAVMDPKTLSVNPYDPNTLKALEKAIVSSPLGLNPRVDGDRLIASVPPLTKEHIQAICKVVSKSCEDVKQSIRRARQKAIDTIKKAGSSFSKDEIKRLEKEVDELTKKFVKSVEDICKAKEREIIGG
ncbi:ribosome-recycling factor [Manihot esculenta]|uniref:Ribosome-recycling factor, chloroplastic n=1 Tax=Manihot esculenta TaxID=3983 RepID=A0A2C9U6Z2_MANES|nr:ribosome-recycling factor [Manihot esculenta]OAY25576.1 hypothetical protein MANES_17G105700v8 [Manihot esculenta]